MATTKSWVSAVLMIWVSLLKILLQYLNLREVAELDVITYFSTKLILQGFSCSS